MTYRFNKRSALLASMVAALVMATPSAALLVQPVFLDMRYTGTRSSAGIQVVNDRLKPISVEVVINQIDIPESGPVSYTPIEGEDFLIYPAVGTIPPNGTQIFRVRWIGEPSERGQMFALTTTELPVEFETDASAAVQLLYAIQTVVAIGPTNGRPQVDVAEAVAGPNSQGASGVRVLFENAGNLHAQISDATLNLSSGDWRHQISPAEMKNAVGLGLVAPGGRRWMFFPIDGAPAEGSVVADLNLAASR